MSHEILLVHQQNDVLELHPFVDIFLAFARDATLLWIAFLKDDHDVAAGASVIVAPHDKVISSDRTSHLRPI